MSGTTTRGLTTLTDSQGSLALAPVSGFVLKLARQSASLTQEGLAEALRVDVSTIQGWESGRRPLAAMRSGDFLRLCGRLSRLGAPASTGRHLREAIEADLVLSTGVAAGADWVDADSHPLAASVHRWTITNLITWPILGKMPQHLKEFVPQTSRRGPTPTRPALSAEERRRFFDHLLTVADRARHSNETLLRRQAVYLLGFDGRQDSVDWLRVEWDHAGRKRLADGDIAGLLEARSASVALALTGDSTFLYDFVARMTEGLGEIANLNYWAYWMGELSDEQTSDDFMLNADTRSWVGARLLQHLVDRLQQDSPHLPLNICTLHALVASRPSLLEGRRAARQSLADALGRVSPLGDLTSTSREQIAGLQYAIRLADR